MRAPGRLDALAWLALFLAAAGAAAQVPAPSLRAQVERDEVGVGEPFRVELRALGPPGTLWSFPERAGNDDVELVLEPPASPSPGEPAPASSAARRYRATVFAVKDVAVPAVSVGYRLPDGTQGEVASAPVPLRLVSLLPKDPKERTLGDVREPLPLDVGWPFWAAVSALALLVAAGAFGLARRRRPGAKAAAPAPPPTPDVEALEALDALARSGLIERQEHRAFYIALADVAKRYLERRLEAPVLEMTSSEALQFLRDHAHGGAFVGPLREVMGAADQVKFARGRGHDEEARRHLGATRALVEQLETRLRPAPVSAEAR